MGFYDELKRSTPPKQYTPVQQIEKDYQRTMTYLFEDILYECKNCTQNGRRQWVSYAQISFDGDSQRYWMNWSPFSPKDRLKDVQNRWSWLLDSNKKSAPASIRNDKNALIKYTVDNSFPDQSKSFRDRLLRDLQKKLVAEGFPASCIRPVDLPITVPTSYSIWTGKTTNWTTVCTCYYIEAYITW